MSWCLLVLLAAGPTPLSLLAPPEAPSALRDEVWPALCAAGRLRPSAVSVSELAERLPEGPGMIWASVEAGEGIHLHRVIFAGRRHVRVALSLDAAAPTAARREAVALALEYLLEAPAGAGEPWRRPELPPAPGPLLPLERADDLVTMRPPGIPPRVLVVPTPPPPLPEPAAPARSAREGARPPPEVVGALRVLIGADLLADLDGASPGFAFGGQMDVAARWRIGLSLSGHPFHDFHRGGRALGVSGTRVALEGGWVRPLGAIELVLRGGVFYSALSGVGGVSTADPRVGLAAGGEVRLRLGGPLSLHGQADLLAAGWASEARFGDEVLLRYGPIQGRLGALLGWAMW